MCNHNITINYYSFLITSAGFCKTAFHTRQDVYKRQATIMVDEAHGLGVFGKQGRGVCDHFGLTHEIDLIMGCLLYTSKATVWVFYSPLPNACSLPTGTDNSIT